MTTTTTTYAGNPRARSDTFSGIACGVGAGALWGLVFLAPELAGDVGPLWLSIGRYLCYGMIAAALIIPRWRTLSAHLDRRRWLELAALALAGNTLYYLLLSSAVQHAGIALTSLVNGFLPVVVTLIGSRDRGAIPIRKLVPSLLLCAAGAACIAWQALVVPGDESGGHRVFGLVCAVGSLACWAAYAVGNSRALARLQRVSEHDWNLLMGMVTGAQSLLLVPLALAIGIPSFDGESWLRLGAVSIGLALIASIAGNTLWNRMSRLLPLTLVGQMILFQTLFAMLYALLWEQRLPTLMEVAGLGLVVASVVSCFSAHRDRALSR